MSQRAIGVIRGRGLRTALVFVAALSLSWCGTPAQAAKLRWKFTPSETLHYQLDQKTTTVMKPGGMEIKTVVTQTIDSTWAVKSVAADGSALMTMTFDRIRNKVDSSLAKFEYDSAEKKDPEGPAAAMMVKTLKALVGVQFKFKLSPLGEVSDIEVPKSLLDSMKSADPNSPEAQMFTEDGWKNMVKESSLVLPADDLAPGKGWSAKGTVPLGPGASLELDKNYIYQGPDAKAATEKIKLDVKMTLKAPANPNLEVKLVNPEGTGAFLFDNQKGRIVSADVTQKIALQIKAGGMEDTRSTEMTNVMTLVDGKSPSPAK
jgi:hypothetical protein